MRVALFIPRYVDAFFPEVGIATLQLLERLGVEVPYPLDQTCCGQMMANSATQKDAVGAEALFVKSMDLCRASFIAGYHSLRAAQGSASSASSVAAFGQ